MIQLDKIAYITVMRTRFGIRFKFRLSTNESIVDNNDYKTLVIYKYLKLISALLEIGNFNIKIEKTKLKKVVILQR